MEFVYRNQEAEAVAIGQSVDMLVTEPSKPDDRMPDADEDMCKRVPQLGDEDGPVWVKTD